MDMQDHSHWTSACERLEVFRTNLPELIDETCVGDYHGIVDVLEKAANVDLSAFRIDADKLEFAIVRSQSAEGVYPPEAIQYSNKMYCDRLFFCTQLGRLLNFIKSIY
jgi:hypothetical protein